MERKGKGIALIAFICVCITIILFCGYRIYSILTPESTELPSFHSSEVDDGKETTGETVLSAPEKSSDTNIDTEPLPPVEPEPEPKPVVLPWNLLLVNRSNPLPEDYTNELTHLSNGQDVDTRIYPALQQMFDDMRAAGVYPVVASGYRTTQKQQEIMDARIQEFKDSGLNAEEAKAEAEKWVAIPGTSEHQLGLCVDINADGVKSSGYEVYDWLAEHAREYGFIQRYPEDKIEITGISNEPWHYRYVGVECAAEMIQLNMCLEEYVEYLTEE